MKQSRRPGRGPGRPAALLSEVATEMESVATHRRIVTVEQAAARALDRAAFEERFERTSTPCVLRGLIDDWPAARSNSWRHDALAARFPEHAFDLGLDGAHSDAKTSIPAFLELAACRRSNEPLLPLRSTVPPAVEGQGVEQQVTSADETDALRLHRNPYIFDAEFGEKLPELLADFSVPAPFPCDDSDFLRYVSENPDLRPQYRWFLVGARGSGFTMHQDPFDTSAWNALVSGGRKRWIMLPETAPLGLIFPSQHDQGVDSHAVK